MDFKKRLSTPVVMENPQADRVKDIATLATRRGRNKKKQFLVEGPQAVREALTSHLHTPLLDAVYVTERAFDRHRDIAELLEKVHGTPTPEQGRKVFMRMVTEEVLEAMSDAVTPQGMIAVAFIQEPDLSRIFFAEGKIPQLVAVLARLQDPGNAGTIIRAADAAGADLIVTTTDTVDIYNPKTVRSTAGSLFHLPVISNLALTEFLDTARRYGMGILAADGYGALDLDELSDIAAAKRWAVPHDESSYDLSQPTAWLFGNEAQGLSTDEKTLADERVAVPVHGSAESLNVSVAAALCLYASARAQHGTKK